MCRCRNPYHGYGAYAAATSRLDKGNNIPPPDDEGTAKEEMAYLNIVLEKQTILDEAELPSIVFFLEDNHHESDADSFSGHCTEGTKNPQEKFRGILEPDCEPSKQGR